MTPISQLDHIPLQAAYLCSDCNAIGNNAVQCPACASRALFNVAGVLNRTEEKRNGN